MKYTLPFLLWAALFTACTQDEADIPQSHSLLELTASMAEPNTRATPDGTWTGGEKVAVFATNHNGGGAAYTYRGWNCGKYCMEWKRKLERSKQPDRRRLSEKRHAVGYEINGKCR